MPINQVNHPVVNAQLSKLRSISSSAKDFREGITLISTILGLEASKTLEEATFEGIQTSPVGPYVGTSIKPRVGLTPVLRAGIGMTDALLALFPEAPVYHLGLFREKSTLQPVEYYSKLPPQPAVDVVYLLDPLVATGGTACAALSMLSDWGVPVSNIKLLCVLGSKEGLTHVQKQFPDLEIWAAGIDETLTERGIIFPGLGDTGDRLFNTVRA